MMSVDLEDHYCDLPFSRWNEYEARITKTTQKILELFKNYNIQATFFVLGYIANRHPALIEHIKSQGHEIASHGYSHTNIKKMSREDFESDLVKSLEILTKVSGEKILGFRAPYFSVNRQNIWAFDVMKKYLMYDSSVVPVKPHYGTSEAPNHMYRVSDSDPFKEDPASSFIEVPMATLRLPVIGNVPIAGGIYGRVIPAQFLNLGIKKINKNGFPAIYYIHPGDFDTERTTNSRYSWYYSVGVKGALKKVEFLLKRFRFSTVREVLANDLWDKKKLSR